MFITSNMAPSRGLLYYSSSTINCIFKVLCQMLSIFSSFKELYFQVCFVIATAMSNSEKVKKRSCRHFLVFLGILTAKSSFISCFLIFEATFLDQLRKITLSFSKLQLKILDQNFLYFYFCYCHSIYRKK